MRPFCIVGVPVRLQNIRKNGCKEALESRVGLTKKGYRLEPASMPNPNPAM